MIVLTNSNSNPRVVSGAAAQYPTVPLSLPILGTLPTPIGQVTISLTHVPQVIGLVPMFDCTPECREGLYTADTIADDSNFILPVFADVASTAAYNNDYNTWLLSFPKGYNAITAGAFRLQKLTGSTWSDVATLNGSTYGTPYQNRFCGAGASQAPPSLCDNFNYQGFKLEWRKVLIGFGVGEYRFKAIGAVAPDYNFCMISSPFCLKQWDCVIADGTIKFEADYSGGRFGSVTTQGEEWSLCCTCISPGTTTLSQTFPVQINDSIRFFGFFGYETASYQRDLIKYQTGIVYKVRDEAIKNFLFRSDKLPLWFHQRFYAYGLMADHLYVSDYNMNNANYNLKHFFIVADGDYAPKYNTWSRYMKVIDVKFKEGQQYVFRDRCCSAPSEHP